MYESLNEVAVKQKVGNTIEQKIERSKKIQGFGARSDEAASTWPCRLPWMMGGLRALTPTAQWPPTA